MIELARFLNDIDAVTANIKNTRHVIVVESYFSNEARWYPAVFKNSKSHFKFRDMRARSVCVKSCINTRGNGAV
jgi:hypothetical protein